MTADLTLKIAGSAISGWTEVAVTRSILNCPSHFDIQMTERFPGNPDLYVVQPGAACQVLLGSDTVLTGYVDSIAPSYRAAEHILRVTGRGKCQDLVDAAAEWTGGQISGTNALDVATKLAQPYGITVSAPDGVGPPVPQFNLSLGETGYEIIERVCRAAQLLVYEDVNGNLVLAQAGDQAHASGIVEGQNIQDGRAEYSYADRFSEYDCWYLATDTFGDLGDGGNLAGHVADPNIKRNRKKYIICDGGDGGKQIADLRVFWESARRFGRGTQIWATADSWRDSAGALWTPNNILPVSAPRLKSERSKAWSIAEVTYRFDDRGTRAELELMPPAAFAPEPILLQPVARDLNLPAAAP